MNCAWRNKFAIHADARIRGEDIAKGSLSLPRAEAGQPEQIKVEIDTPDSGRVRITYYLQRYKRGKSHYWFWAAHHAETVAAPAAGPA